MTDNKLLQQDEIDALLRSASGNPEIENQPTDEFDTSSEDINQSMQLGEPQVPAEDTAITKYEDLRPEERDALGEVGNISMGSASTTLSQLLNRRVLITSPEVIVTSQEEFLSAFKVPFLIIQVKFVEGFDGYNVLVIKLHDAMVMANLMMGGDGEDISDEISEMEISAAAEAMNQMIGTASTSLADLMNRSVNIAPPETIVIHESDKFDVKLPFDDPIVISSFKMNIENLLDTNIMQILNFEGAREQAKLLLQNFGMLEDYPEETAAEQFAGVINELDNDTINPGNVNQIENNEIDDLDAILKPKHEDYYPEQQTLAEPEPLQSAPRPRNPELANVDPEKLNMLLDIPLKISVVLGRTQKSIKDVLSMTPGAIAELETLVDEPVDILVNGKLVAKGEVVVVNENFGVKITSIVSQRERIKSLR